MTEDLPPGGFLTRELVLRELSSHWSPPIENDESCMLRPPDLVNGR